MITRFDENTVKEMISARSKQAQDTCRSIKVGCNETDKKIMALNSTHSARMQKADKTLEAKVSFACTKEAKRKDIAEAKNKCEEYDKGIASYQSRLDSLQEVENLYTLLASSEANFKKDTENLMNLMNPPKE